MTIIQLLLGIISILLSPPSSEAVVPSNVTTAGPSITNSVAAVPSVTNSVAAAPPNTGNPTEVLCDVLRPNTCAPSFVCLNGKCTCPGNMIYSLTYRACKIRAGGFGCQKSGDCTDFGCCFHPRVRECHRCYHHHYPYGPYHHVHHYEHSGEGGPTQCHCKLGPTEGINGVCEPAEPNDRCSAFFASPNPFVIATIITTSFFCRILNC